MPTLVIRNVDPSVKELLRVRAALHGRSMEAELRSLINEALERDRDRLEQKLAETIRRRLAPLGGTDPEPQPPEPAGAPPSCDP
jgi:plasmid stability protein